MAGPYPPIFEGEDDEVQPPVQIYHSMEEIKDIFRKNAGPVPVTDWDRSRGIFGDVPETTVAQEKADRARQAFLQKELKWLGLGLFLVGLLFYIFSRLGPG